MKEDRIRRGRLGGERGCGVSRFLSSMEADRRIAEADVLVDMAHLLMLRRRDLIGDEHARAIMEVLLEFDEEGLPEEVFDDRYEDLHAGIEAYLIDRLGEETGGRIHAGRSRNDEVSACIRIRARDDLIGLMAATTRLREVLLTLAGEHTGTVMPGFTHLQHAQPTTLAHHLLAYEEAFSRDFARLRSAYTRVNESPLGAAAFASTGFPIDREYTRKLLGFDRLIENSMDAVSSRDFLLEALSSCTILSTTASRLSADLILWSSPLAGFVTLSDEFCSTSSIMPQKKNPDTLEILRAKSGTAIGSLAAALAIVKALPMSYNRDLQEATPHLWQGISAAGDGIPILAEALATATFHPGRMAEEAGKGFSTATGLADLLVQDLGIPFRTAHTIVGKAVRAGRLDRDTLEKAGKQAFGISLSGMGLTREKVKKALDVHSQVEARKVTGGPAPATVKKAIRARKEQLRKDRAGTASLEAALRKARERLLSEARGLLA
ncbi:MAG TPA: argininosuccinate lyase [Methanomicrobiales archaeon]|nr:argininosuccinate lyase [Methanomicrobiales archaeon]